MSYTDPHNPYASPPAAALAPGKMPAFKPIDKIEYLRVYKYVFENPNWLPNILLTTLCMLIPVIGGLIAIGYQFEVVSMLLLTQGARYPDFNFNRFADYLMRGLWPFLVQLIASFVLTPVFFVIIGVPLLALLGTAGAAGEEGASVVLLVGIPVVVLLSVLLSIPVMMLLVPPMLRAGLAQDFAEGFNFGWVMHFLKKTWKEMFLGLLFLSFSAAILGMLGVLACYVGLFVVMPLVILAQGHLYYQLYVLYLSRGGTPIPEKPSPALYAPPM
jgi:hypothetical protein